MPTTANIAPAPGDALIVVDVQNDFLPGGSLGVQHGDAVIAPLNACIRKFRTEHLPIFASRDWHPAAHCSFTAGGGDWPAHCVAGTTGAAFASALDVTNVEIISKAERQQTDAYSAFDSTPLAARLHELNSARLFIGGLATDYCVKATVLDAISAGFTVILLEDAVRAVNVSADDGDRAIAEMLAAGAMPVSSLALTA